MKRFLSYPTSTWASRVYLAVVAAVLAWALWSTFYQETIGANMAVVVPLLMTLPAMVIVMPVMMALPTGEGWEGALTVVVAIAIAALLNAAALNYCLSLLNRTARGIVVRSERRYTAS